LKIVGGTLWLAGPFGTVYALAAEGIAAIGHDGRDVRPDEYALAQLVFGPATPPRGTSSGSPTCPTVGTMSPPMTGGKTGPAP
jgi:hypothetical protein